MHRALIRLSDILFSGVGIVLLSPLLLVILIAVWLTSGWPAIYRQVRVGKHGHEFKLMKFRTMRIGSERSGSLTVGGRDPRVTGIGYFLRRYKLDELPQLFHVLTGTMSLVGPRPEVPAFVRYYKDEQKEILTIPPGITDEASLVYFNENELLSKVEDPQSHYIHRILPDKIRINLEYVRHRTLPNYLRTVARTLGRIVFTK